MRIAVLTNAYPPQARGGAGRIAALQVELLRRQGHEVRVWTTSLGWTVCPAWKRLGFHLRDLGWIHPVAKEIIDWKPETLLTHNLTGAGFRTPSALQRQGICWLHVLHDVQLFHPVGLLQNEQPVSVLQRVVTSLRKPIFGQPDVVISPTDWLLQAHARRGWFQGCERVVVPNPAPESTVAETRGWGTPLKLLFVGRVSPDKGKNVLLSLMQSAPCPVVWQVVGAGATALQTVVLPVGSSLTAFEETTPEIVLEHMRTADALLVLSQIEENQPTVLLEAFASGLPAVAQAKGGILETLGSAGLVVHSSEASDWWRAIEKLTAEPRAVWSARAIETWKRHAPERVVEVLLGLLKSNKKI
jgi:glycosyltransferase involved in cell wall biosynthesis